MSTSTSTSMIASTNMSCSLPDGIVPEILFVTAMTVLPAADC